MFAVSASMSLVARIEPSVADSVTLCPLSLVTAIEPARVVRVTFPSILSVTAMEPEERWAVRWSLEGTLKVREREGWGERREGVRMEEGEGEEGMDLRGKVLKVFGSEGKAFSLKEIKAKTGATEADIKTILVVYCEYNKKGDNKQKWSLKKEYAS